MSPRQSLVRPAAGEVRADYLADGTPVWVIGHEDETVSVLSSFSTHVPLNLITMVWWCPSALGLDDPAFGSKWDEHGIKLGGPAPTGLPTWDVTLEDDRVVVGDVNAGAPIGTEPDGPSDSERTWCTLEDPVIFHAFEGWTVWDSPTEAVASAPEGWIRLDGKLEIDASGSSVNFCSPAGCSDSVATDVEVPPFEFGPEAPLGEQFIGRVRDGALVASRARRCPEP